MGNSIKIIADFDVAFERLKPIAPSSQNSSTTKLKTSKNGINCFTLKQLVREP
jgi:hypothetical protein